MRNTHCLKGLHELRGENLYLNPTSGSRQCKACKSAQQREYRRRNFERIQERKREYNERAEYMLGWHERNREHEAEYRKTNRARILELRRAKYAEDYAKPERRAKREADRERVNEKSRERARRDKDLIRARKVRRDLEIEQAIGTPRTGRYTAAEDAVVLRDDLTVIEKCFMLQRKPDSVKMRKCYLSDTTKARLEKQREKIAEYQRNYRECNRDRLDLQQQAYRQQNAEVLRQKGRQSYYANRQARIAAVRRYALLNPEKTKETQRRYMDRQRAKRQQAAA